MNKLSYNYRAENTGGLYVQEIIVLFPGILYNGAVYIALSFKKKKKMTDAFRFNGD